MYPDLVSIGNFTLHTYGLCIALGALLGILFVARGARREGLNQQQLLDLVFYLLIAAIVGSRVFYIILNPGYYLKHPLESLMIWRGGLVFYGGVSFCLSHLLSLPEKARAPLSQNMRHPCSGARPR